MNRSRLLRGCIVLLLLSAALVYLNRESERKSYVVKTTPESPKLEKQKKSIVVPIQVIEKKPAPKKEQKKTKKPVPEKQPNSSNSGQKKGDEDPAVLASYKMDVKSYLHFMQQQGAQMGLYDTSAEKFICAINQQGVMGGQIRQIGMSTRARRITADFPNSRRILRQAILRFGPAKYEILLLIPSRMDKRFYQNISKLISQSGRNIKDVSLVRVTYEGSQNTVRVKVNSFEGIGGTSAVSGSFYL